MKKRVAYFIVILCMLLACLFGKMAYKEYEPVANSKEQNEIIRENVIIEVYSPYDRIIDFNALEDLNSDIAGWIYIPGTSIDYPILIGDTDEEYLYKDVNGQWSELGSIFSYSDTDRSLQDGITYLFGHNMLEYQMFGELRCFLDEEFRKEHRTMYVYTEERTMELEIYSVFICLETDDLFSHVGIDTGSEEYRTLLSMISERNDYTDIHIPDIESLSEKQTVTMVTCHGDPGTVYRLIVNGIVKNEKRT